MNIRFRLAPLFLLALAAACQGEESARKGATGEVLPGSASDAMLPLDTVRSQPPLAPQTQSARPADKGAASQEPGEDQATASAEPSAAATAEPAPVASAAP